MITIEYLPQTAFTFMLIFSRLAAMIMLMPVDPASAMPDIVFYICGAVIGACGGSLQAASRTMMVRQANPDRMTEAFGMFALSGKVMSFAAPALIALATTVTQSQRLGVTPLILLFVIGLVLLLWVKPEGEDEAYWTQRTAPA